MTDRTCWEKRGSQKMLALTDELHEIVQDLDPGPELKYKYNKLYIGLSKEGQACNFVVFRPEEVITEVLTEASKESSA